MNEGKHIGSYRLLSRIGEGGMGDVWLAEHVTLGRRAAIKLLRPEVANHEGIAARFFNEARAAAAIHDPGIVQIFEVGEHEGGSGYIVMELLDGEPLDRRLARGALAISDAVRIMRQVASSLAAAHALGIVHRDLKPENIFLVRDPEVAGGERAKILDFGIAKLTGSVGVKTQTFAMMGTPTYMSPEQCRGAGDVDVRSDIYSFGCVLFQLVTGRPPFVAEGVGEIISMHLREPAPSASSIAPHVTDELSDLIARCLAKSPDERVASATELAAQLGALASVRAAAAMTQIAVIPLHSMPTTLSSMALEVQRPRATGRWFLGSAAAVAACGIVAYAVLTRSSGGVDERVGSGSAVTAAVPAISLPPPPLPPAVVERLLVASVGWTFATIADTASARPTEPVAPKKPPVATKKAPIEPPPSQPIDCFTHRC